AHGFSSNANRMLARFSRPPRSRATPTSTRSDAESSKTSCARGGSMDDVVLNKAAIIERCVRRVREEHAGDDRRLTEDITRQDSIILNLQRACEAAIDLAMHLVRVHR